MCSSPGRLAPLLRSGLLILVGYEVLHHAPHNNHRRFIKNNLIVEITSSARLARMFGWLLKRHTMLSFYLYTAGFVRCALRCASR